MPILFLVLALSANVCARDDFFKDVGTWFEGAGEDIESWTEGAANDYVDWFDKAEMNTMEWVEENPGLSIEIGAVATGTAIALADPMLLVKAGELALKPVKAGLRLYDKTLGRAGARIPLNAIRLFRGDGKESASMLNEAINGLNQTSCWLANGKTGDCSEITIGEI
jgi:hypothetical protein